MFFDQNILVEFSKIIYGQNCAIKRPSVGWKNNYPELDSAQMYLQPHFGNGVFGNVHFLAGPH